MYRLYVGNLDRQVAEETLHSLFQEHDLSPTSILVRRGYAFVDCSDQQTLDTAIDKLNGYNLMGSVMQVEPSTMSKRRSPIPDEQLLVDPAHNTPTTEPDRGRSDPLEPAVEADRRSNRITIRNVPQHVAKDDLERLVATFGSVQKCERVDSNMDTSVHVAYETPDQAQDAVDQLNNYEYQGSVLKVDFMNNGRPNRSRPNNSGTGNNRGTGHPLRILVPSDFVGAIIGRQGQTIRNITTQSRARVDVHGKENSGLLEKVISIYGSPDNCTNACKEILKVMQQEANTTNRGEITLKMLADDRYCGRIIGKEGKVIKKVREDTNTRITVSKNYSFAYHSVQEMPAMYPDRVITIKGTIDNMSAAEAAITAKLRECHEKEMLPLPGMMMNPGFQGLPMMAGGVYGMRPPYNMMQQQQQQQQQGYYPGMGYGSPMQQQQQYGQQQPIPPHQQQMPSTNDVCHISVPNSSVGAIIGTKGINIKQIIRDSNAHVTIEPKKDDDPNPAAERIVTIKGSPEAQWRASYFVFDKLKQEGFSGGEDVRLRTALKIPRSMVGRVIGKSGRNASYFIFEKLKQEGYAGDDDVRLCTAIKVPKIMVGRVIGKGGKNVRDVQRMTGAIIKLPEDPANQGEETIVEILGNFMATQCAQSRVRALVCQGAQQGLQSPPGGPGPARQGGPRGPRGPGGPGGPNNNYGQN